MYTNLNKTDVFSIYFPNYEKLKCFVKTFTPYNQILVFEGKLLLSNMDFYILWILTKSKLTVYEL
jgi:hypothetical protein